MGKCDLCREETGVLGREHKECEAAAQRIRTLVDQTALGSGDGSTFAAEYEAARAANGHRIVDSSPALRAWSNAVARVLDDRILSEQEELRLMSIAKAVGIEQTNGGEAWVRMVKAAILRELTEGRIPERAKVSGTNANLMKKERPVWLFNGSKFFEERTQRSFRGVSHGLSVRIAKGVYYRPSVFRGAPVETTKLTHVDNGNVLVTSHHLYFLGTRKSSRVPYRKIVSFEPYKDAIGVQRDAITARPQIFTVDDAWFGYSLVTNLAAMSAE